MAVNAAPASAVQPPLDDDVAPFSVTGENPLLQRLAPLAAVTGPGFMTLDPGTVGVFQDQRSYTLRLVTNGQGNVETMRSALETAAANAANASGISLTVAPGTVPDTTPDREPDRGEILLSIDATSPCTGNWAGCGGPRSFDYASNADAWLIRSGRIWVIPAAASYSTADRNHLVAHELGHALGLAHFDSGYPTTQLQVMHSSSYDASAYRAGDANGLRFLLGPLMFGTPPVQPSAILQSSGDQNLYFRDSDGTIDTDVYTASSGQWNRYDLKQLAGQPLDALGNPAAVRQSNGNQHVYFRAEGGSIQRFTYTASTGVWSRSDLAQLSGTPTEAIGDPAVISQPSGTQNVYFRSLGNTIQTQIYEASTGQWSFYDLAQLVAPAAAAGDPVVLRQPNGTQNIYFRASNGNIKTYVYDGPTAQWNLYDLAQLGGAATAVGDPAALLQPNGNQNIYFRASDGNIKTYVYVASTGQWNLYDLGQYGGAGAAAGDPTSELQPNGNQNIYFRASNGNIKTYVYVASTGQWNYYDLGGQAAGTPTSFLQPNGDQNVFYQDASGAPRVLIYNAGAGTWTHYTLP